MAKDKPSSSSAASKAKKKKTVAPPKRSAEATRGKSHTQLLSQRAELKSKLKSLPSNERTKILSHFHGSDRTDLSKARISNLKQDDMHRDTSNLSDYQIKSLNKRKFKPNMALQRSMHRRETKRMSNAMDAADAEDILHTHTAGLVEVETDMERTVQLTQQQLKHNNMLPDNVAQNIYDIDLQQYGPYKLRYDRSGKHALLAGKSGHVSVIDQHTLALKTEFHLENDTIRDAIFLHSNSMMAVSQEKYVYIYDEDGVEIHRMSGHKNVMGMEFLPYHWLLATIGSNGVLQYQDTSTGNLVSQHRSKMGPCHAIRQNPFNSILHLGHTNGTVTLWSPSSSEYLVKMLCHKGSPITSLAIDRSGRYMATGGGDSKVKIFDLRMYKEVHSYKTFGGAPTCLDISQTGVLGIGHGCHSTFWKPEALKVKMNDPYMKHELSGKGPLESLRFRPFEDVCGIGHTGGISSIVIPGSGEPNLDSMEHFTNPYMDTKQRREAEVRSLLEKLSPDMIALDPDTVGGIEESNLIQRQQRMRDLAEEADARKSMNDEERKKEKEKKRMRGRSKITKKLNRKNKNIIDENTAKFKEMKEKEKAEREMEKKREACGDWSDGGPGDEVDEAPAALKRFF